MKRVLRALQVAWVLCLVAVIVLPALPAEIGGKPSTKIAGWMRQLSVKQHWGMYAPDPQRSQTYMNLTAELRDGTAEFLEETDIQKQGWGTRWAWHKTRTDIWRHYANFKPRQRNPHRHWYLRGACVREARRRGTPPHKIVMTQVRRKFTPPAKVRAGRPGLGPKRRRKVHEIRCDDRTMLQQIEADRGRS